MRVSSSLWSTMNCGDWLPLGSPMNSRVRHCRERLSSTKPIFGWSAERKNNHLFEELRVQGSGRMLNLDRSISFRRRVEWVTASQISTLSDRALWLTVVGLDPPPNLLPQSDTRDIVSTTSQSFLLKCLDEAIRLQPKFGYYYCSRAHVWSAMGNRERCYTTWTWESNGVQMTPRPRVAEPGFWQPVRWTDIETAKRHLRLP